MLEQVIASASLRRRAFGEEPAEHEDSHQLLR
jgi:hypothetical protein